MNKTKKKFKLDLRNVYKCIKEVDKAMSLEEIENKFNVRFPYQVIGVKNVYDKHCPPENKINLIGKVFTITDVNFDDRSRFFKETNDFSRFDATIKRFKLYE